MMIVVSIIAILGAIAVAGFRANEFQGQYRRFVEDIHGAFIAARNSAIDEQRQVTVTVDATGMRVTTLLPPNDEEQELSERRISQGYDDLLSGSVGCMMGFQIGVRAPSQAQDVIPPTACLTGTPQVLVFDPDGTFVLTNPPGGVGAGVSLWIADMRTGAPVRSLIQLFPGGYIRMFNHVS